MLNGRRIIWIGMMYHNSCVILSGNDRKKEISVELCVVSVKLRVTDSPYVSNITKKSSSINTARNQ